jgi:hypothetical protein
MDVGRMSSGCPVRLPARAPLPAKALAGMPRGLSPNLRTMLRASLVERFAIRLLRMGFFAAGRLACAPFAGFAACRSSAARRAAGLARRGVVMSPRFAGSWGADSWAADSWDADCWGGKPWSTNSGGLDLRGAGSFAMNSCATESWVTDSWVTDSRVTDSWGTVAVCRLSVKGCSAALSGSDGAATVPPFEAPRPAVKSRSRRAKQFRSKCSQDWCLQALAVESEISARATSGHSTAEKSKAGTPTAIMPPNAISEAAVTKRRCEYKAISSEKAAPPPRRFGARTSALWRDYVRSRRRFPVETETLFNTQKFWRITLNDSPSDASLGREAVLFHNGNAIGPHSTAAFAKNQEVRSIRR